MVWNVKNWKPAPDGWVRHGAMGTVIQVVSSQKPEFQAVIKHPKSEVLRLLDADEVLREIAKFREEIELMITVASPSVPKVFDSGEAIFPDVRGDMPIPYVVIEDLSDSVELKSDDIPSSLALLVGTLQALHSFTFAFGEVDGQSVNGIEHRDIKTDNAWLMKDGRVVVMDFGLARWSNDPRAAVASSRAGTPVMMAPELLDTGRKIDARADLFSAGAMVYEIVTGEAPYPGNSVDEVLFKMRSSEPSRDVFRPSDLISEADAEKLNCVVEGLLQKDPTLRYQSAWEALADISKIQSVNDLLEKSPLTFPINPEGFAESELEKALLRFAHSRPTPLLLEVVAPIFTESIEAFKDYLIRAWDSGFLATGAQTIQAFWPGLVTDKSLFTRLSGKLEPIAKLIASLEEAISSDEVLENNDFDELDGIDDNDLDEVLNAWVAVTEKNLDHSPWLKIGLAKVASRTGRHQAAYEMLSNVIHESAQILKARLAVRLNLPEAEELLAGLDESAQKLMIQADYSLQRQDPLGVLSVTEIENIPSDAEPFEVLQIIARRLRVRRFLIRVLAEADESEENQNLLNECRVDVESTIALIKNKPYFRVRYPVGLDLALGTLAADNGDIDLMNRYFSSAKSQLSAGDYAERFMIAEATYLAHKDLWNNPKTRKGKHIQVIAEATAAAIRIVEQLHDRVRLMNSLVNRAEALIIDISTRRLPSIDYGHSFDESISSTRKLIDEVFSLVERIKMIQGSKPYDHDVTLKLVVIESQIAQIVTDVMSLEHKIKTRSLNGDEGEYSSNEGLARLHALRSTLIGSLGETSRTASDSAGYQSVDFQLLKLIHSSSDIDRALERVLDGLIEHLGADKGMIYWGPPGCKPDQAIYHSGRNKSGGSFKEEPLMSRTLKGIAMDSEEVQIRDSKDPDLIGTESVLMMGADVFLISALGNRGALIFSVDTEEEGRSFGAADIELVSKIAPSLASQLSHRETQDLMQRQALENEHRLATIFDDLHDAKNEIVGIAAIAERLIRIQMEEFPQITDEDQFAAVEKGFESDLVKMHTDTVGVQKRTSEMLLDMRKRPDGETKYIRPDEAPEAHFTKEWLLGDGAGSNAAYLPPKDLVAAWRELWRKLTDGELSRANPEFLIDDETAFPAVVFDRAELAKIFNNVWTNVVDLLKDHPEPKINTKLYVDGLFAVIEVTENGPGMDQELVERVTDKHGYTTKTRGRGSGVGIPALMRAMQRHGGVYEIQSQIGIGTTQRFKFPLGEPVEVKQ